MTFDLKELMEERHGDNFALHAQYLNPQLTKVVTTLGFDRFYERGEGCYLIDDDGNRYLDMLSGFGVFALGRSHPVIKDALRQALDADLPGMVQMDCALLPGLLGRTTDHAQPEADRATVLLQLRRRGRRSGDQVRSRQHRSSTDPVSLARLSRSHHGCARRERFGRLSRGLRAALGRHDGDSLRRPRHAGARTQARRRGGIHHRTDSGQGRLRTRGRALARTRERRARRRGALHLRRGADGTRSHRLVLRLRALRTDARHHHDLQGPLRWVHPGRRDADQRQDPSRYLQLDGPRDGPLDDVQEQPDGHGGGTGDTLGLRRRAHHRTRGAPWATYGGCDWKSWRRATSSCTSFAVEDR